MKIAVWHALPSGGGLRALTDQVRGLSERGHEIQLWCPPGAHAVDAGEQAVHVVPCDVPQSRGARDDLLEAWRRRRRDLDAFEAHSERCAREIAAWGADVLLAHPAASYRPSAVGRFSSVRSVLYLQEPDRALFEAGFGFPWRAPYRARGRFGVSSLRSFVAELARVERRRIEVREQTDWVNAFDEVLVNSAFSREAVQRAYGRRSEVSPLGIDAERFAWQDRPPSARGSLLSIGAMVDAKSPHFLVEAAAAAGSAVARFVWVANHVDERCRATVERAARELGVPFELRVGVDDDALLAACAEADVFVFAPVLEPLGLAPLEANATGLPVVAVAEGGVRETMVDGVNGVIVERDAQDFADVVVALLGSPDRLRELGRSARRHVVEHWDLTASIDRLEAHLLGA